MQMNLVIRQARRGDSAAISVLINAVAQQFSVNRGEALARWFAESITPYAISKCISDKQYNYLVALCEGVLVGVIAVRDNTHIHHLFVAPSFHRCGVATQLWQRARSDALSAGNQEGFSVRSSEYAVAVYERFGFHVVGQRGEKDGMVFVPMRLVL